VGLPAGLPERTARGRVSSCGQQARWPAPAGPQKRQGCFRGRLVRRRLHHPRSIRRQRPSPGADERCHSSDWFTLSTLVHGRAAKRLWLARGRPARGALSTLRLPAPRCL